MTPRTLETGKDFQTKDEYEITLDGKLTAEQFSEWLEARQAFMEMMGWKFGPDNDEYDEDPKTFHILNIKPGNHMQAGLRLTPRQSIDETLSFGMMPLHLKEEALLKVGNMGPVWDLTRLVPGKAGLADPVGVFSELFAAGFAMIQQHYDSDPRWIFATSAPFFDIFKDNGIEFTEVVRGRFNPDDSYDSVFCYADPLERTQFLIDNRAEYPVAYRNVMAGIDRVRQGNM